jgi:hypothetical protein
VYPSRENEFDSLALHSSDPPRLQLLSFALLVGSLHLSVTHLECLSLHTAVTPAVTATGPNPRCDWERVRHYMMSIHMFRHVEHRRLVQRKGTWLTGMAPDVRIRGGHVRLLPCDFTSQVFHSFNVQFVLVSSECFLTYRLLCPFTAQTIYIDITSCITDQYWYYFLESRHSHAFVSSFQPQPSSTSVCTSAAYTCVDWDLTRLLRGDVLK